MKIHDEFPLDDLPKYGFYKPRTFESDDWELQEAAYIYDIGHSRRGQCYFLTVNFDREVHLYATAPDGKGTHIEFPNVVKRLISDRVLVLNENQGVNNG